ncbi:MAG: hypothetical protein ABW195_05525 [Ilumatobacteraceae bacterium]
MSTSPTFSRRSLLRSGGLVGATLVVAGTGALSYRVYDQRILDPGGGPALDPWRTWRDDPGPLGAVAAAILAANPHNTQPWVFAVSPTAIDVFADPARGTGTVDPFRREQHVGLGCAIENLVLAAAALGLEPTLTWLPAGADDEHVARVALGASVPRPSPLHDAIGERHTHRGPYLDRAVDAAALARLDPDEPGVGVHWVTSERQRSAMGELMVDAAVAITTDDQQSLDAFRWFRSTDDAIQRHRDGLTLDGQDLRGLVRTLAKLAPAASRRTGDEFWVRQTREVHTRTAAAYGILTVDDATSRPAQLAGGRALERIHLAATRDGVALHHMNQVTERIDRERQLGQSPELARRMQAFLPPGAEPLVAFRVGVADHPARRSPRRPVDAVVRP